jgi:large subunit ribosomal protein L9
MDIFDGLAAKGFHIERRKIHLAAPLKITGEYQVPVKLHREVTTPIKVTVDGEFENPPAGSPVPVSSSAPPVAEDQLPADPKE